MKRISREPAMHEGSTIDNVNGYGILDCKACSFVHIDPIPSPEELGRIYRDEYYRDEKPLYIERLIEDLEWWNAVYDDRYDFFESRLPKENRRILDIGCGPGYFLKRGQERGWRCMGIEPSSQAFAHAKGLGIDVVNAFLNDAAAAIGHKFDAIHISEVLEHVPDPADILRKAHGLLDKGGVLCCVAPNDYSPLQRLLAKDLGFRPYWLAPPHHINYFTFGSLKNLLTGAGFRIEMETAMFPLELFLLMGENYVGDDKTGRRCHEKRKLFDLRLRNDPALKDFRAGFYKLISEFKMGREIIIYAKK